MTGKKRVKLRLEKAFCLDVTVGSGRKIESDCMNTESMKEASELGAAVSCRAAGTKQMGDKDCGKGPSDAGKKPRPGGKLISGIGIEAERGDQ